MKGYEERTETEAAMLRIASFRIHQSLVQKPLTIEKYWPLPSDKEGRSRDTLIMTKEMLAKIKKAHNLK